MVLHQLNEHIRHILHDLLREDENGHDSCGGIMEAVAAALEAALDSIII